MQAVLLVILAITLCHSTVTPVRHPPRQVLVTKFVKNVGPTNPTAFIDLGRQRLKSWNVLTRAQLRDLDTTDKNFFWTQAGINISTGVPDPSMPDVIYGPTWVYFPVEVESDERLDWVVADTYNTQRTNGRQNWILANGGNAVTFTADGVFEGGEWQGLSFVAGSLMISEYVIMVPNVTKSQWNRNYELHKCRTELEPGLPVLNFYDQTNSIIVKSCVGVRGGRGNTAVGGSKSTTFVTNVYTNTSETTRDERKTHSWTWGW
ncbi:Hypothetical protein POVR2_LOCUS71 [uncultured virus]|nr:Hypothetical protein POVR2_LOCUS71 [uncultured virus]